MSRRLTGKVVIATHNAGKLAEMRELLALWRDERRASADVKRLALAHVAQFEDKARAIAEMSRALRDLADRCDGDHRPDCPIIDELASTMVNGAGMNGAGPVSRGGRV